MLEEVTVDTLTEVGAADGAENSICLVTVTSYHYKCKKHFIKMLKDVGMVAPKIKETRL